jgi:hypothetical protein
LEEPGPLALLDHQHRTAMIDVTAAMKRQVFAEYGLTGNTGPLLPAQGLRD